MLLLLIVTRQGLSAVEAERELPCLTLDRDVDASEQFLAKENEKVARIIP